MAKNGKMKTVHNWRSDEPWKKHEPGSRLTATEKKRQSRSQGERSAMEHKSKQNVKIVFKNWLFGLPAQIRAFEVELSIPLSTEEIMKRMGAAFPELELKLPEEGT